MKKHAKILFEYVLFMHGLWKYFILKEQPQPIQFAMLFKGYIHRKTFCMKVPVADVKIKSVRWKVLLVVCCGVDAAWYRKMF